MRHELKIQSKYFKDVVSGAKKFEVRRDDRDYHVGDTLNLCEIIDDKHSDRHCEARIIYILKHEDFPEAIKEGYVVLGIRTIK